MMDDSIIKQQDCINNLKYYKKDMMEMKNIIKKIASIAMAFTLLGTGTAVTKTISPNYGSTLTASSANSVCQYHHGTKRNGKTINNCYIDNNGNKRCKCCGQIVGEPICSGEHDWYVYENNKWYGWTFKGINHKDGSKLYIEYRIVDVKCKKCGFKTAKKQYRSVVCYSDGRENTSKPGFVK